MADTGGGGMTSGNRPGPAQDTTDGLGGSTESPGSDPTAADGASSTGSTGSTGETSTGVEFPDCDICADSEICVQNFNQKVCIFCEDSPEPPYIIECVAERPEACDDNLSHDLACTLALCNSPYDEGSGCGCLVDSDFICGVNPFIPYTCDFWTDPQVICGPVEKCVPALDEDYEPLPYTHCAYPLAESLGSAGEPCEAESIYDDCELTAFCDEVDPSTGMGVCRALCIGTEAMPTCVAPDETCVLFFEDQPEFGGVCRPT